MALLTISQAQTYFDGRMFTQSWDRASSTDQGKAITHATRIVNNLQYHGIKTDPNQDDEFPRDSKPIPQDVLDAIAEIALSLLDGIDPEREREAFNVTSTNYSGVKATYSRDFGQLAISAGVPSRAAWDLLQKYLIDPSAVKIVRVS